MSTLKDQAGQKGASKAASRFRASLATAQIALSMTLLVAAGLFTRSLLNVTRVDLGIRTDNVVTFAIAPELNGYTPERTAAFFERLEDELAAVPGVTSVTASTVALIAGSNWGNNVSVQGFEAGPDTDTTRTSPGRPGIFPHARRAAPCRARVHARRRPARTESCRRQRGVREEVQPRPRRGRQANDEPLGHRQPARHRDRRPGPECEIQRGEAGGSAACSSCRTGRTSAWASSTSMCAPRVIPSSCLPPIGGVVARLDPNLPVDDLKTLQQQVEENVFLDRMISTLSAAFAILATLLAGGGTLRRAGLHRGAAHPRDRLAHGAGGRWRARARHGAAAGRVDDRRSAA